jgi:hypothetical protein
MALFAPHDAPVRRDTQTYPSVRTSWLMPKAIVPVSLSATPSPCLPVAAELVQYRVIVPPTKFELVRRIVCLADNQKTHYF